MKHIILVWFFVLCVSCSSQTQISIESSEGFPLSTTQTYTSLEAVAFPFLTTFTVDFEQDQVSLIESEADLTSFQTTDYAFSGEGIDFNFDNNHYVFVSKSGSSSCRTLWEVESFTSDDAELDVELQQNINGACTDDNQQFLVILQAEL